jgi:hypothetical protein
VINQIKDNLLDAYHPLFPFLPELNIDSLIFSLLFYVKKPRTAVSFTQKSFHAHQKRRKKKHLDMPISSLVTISLRFVSFSAAASRKRRERDRELKTSH